MIRLLLPSRAGLSLAVALLLTRAAAQPPATLPPAEPPEPAASPAVARLLAGGARLLEARQFAEGLAQAEAALAAASSGNDNPGEAGAQRLRALCLGELGKREEARAAWEAAGRLWRELRDGPEQVEALGGRALLLPTGQAVGAVLAEAARIAVGERRRPLAAAARLDERGNALRRGGRPSEALVLLRPALALREQYAPGSRDVAVSLHSLGSATHLRGDLAEAKRYHNQALELWEKLAPGSLDVASSLNNLGLVVKDLGDLAGAKRYLEQALALREKLAPGSLVLAASLYNLGSVAVSQSDLTGARPYFEQDLAITAKLAPGSLDLADTLLGLGSVAKGQGDLAGAKRYYEQALVIQEKLAPGSLRLAYSLGHLGLVAQDQGDLAGAKQYHEQALALREKLAPGSLAVATSLNNLGRVTEDQGDLAGATRCYEQALVIREKQAPGSLAVASSLINLGNVAYYQGDLPGARRCYERCLAIREKLAPGSLAWAACLQNLGNVARNQGDLVGARRYHEQSLATKEQLAPGSLDLAMSLRDTAELCLRQKDLAGAEPLLARAWQLVRSQSTAVSGDEAGRAFAFFHNSYARDLTRVRLALGRPDVAFRTLEEGRAQSLQQAIREQHLAHTAAPAARAAHAAAFNAEQIARTALGQAQSQEQRARTNRAVGAPAQHAALQAALEIATRDAEAARAELTQRRLERERAWAKVKETAPRDALSDPLPLPQARGALQPGDVFLAYSVAEAGSHLYLFTGGPQGRLETFTLVRDEKGWRASVRRFLGEVEELSDDPTAERRAQEAARMLTGLLLPPGALARVRAARRVIVSPDGPLWNVPFAALWLARSGRAPEQYLGLAKPVVLAQSLSLYARAVRTRTAAQGKGTLAALTVGDCLFSPTAVAAARRQAPGSVAVVGDGPTPGSGSGNGSSSPGGKGSVATGSGVASGSVPGSGILVASLRGPREILRGEETDWAPLPATGPEAAGIAKLYGGKYLSQLHATEPEVRSLLGQARVIHLATHGRYHQRDALLSGLILTVPAPGDPVSPATDGVLEAAEVLDPALSLRAEVVVLSGCQTGRGVLSKGEGLVGLTRAWQIAGARSVVASQWLVADESTRVLMLAFHRGVQAGLAKDEAMRKAMVERV